MNKLSKINVIFFLFIVISSLIILIWLVYGVNSFKTITPKFTLAAESDDKTVLDLTISLFKQNNLLKISNAAEKSVISAQMADVAKIRYNALDNLIRLSPSAAFKYLLSEKHIRALPKDLKPYLETNITLQGKFIWGHTDLFESKTIKPMYFLQSDSETYSLDPVNLESGYALVPSGSQVKLRAVRLGKYIMVDIADQTSFQKTNKTVNNLVLGDTTYKKVAYILVNTKSNPVTPFTAEDVRKRAFTDVDSVASFYREASFGQVIQTGKKRTDGDVFGWVTISDTPCPPEGIASGSKVDLANKALQTQNIDLTGYDNLVYLFLGSSVTNCYGGTWSLYSYYVSQLAVNSDPDDLYKYFPVAAIHEEGHNYGLAHANMYICKDGNGNLTSMSNNCSDEEYGDYYDVMGGGPYTMHFSAFHKLKLNYILSMTPNMVDSPFTNGVFSYTLAPIEQNTTTPQVVRIPRSADSTGSVNSYYYLDFRQPIGYFDVYDPYSHTANVNKKVFKGILIRLFDSDNTQFSSRLLTAHPQQSSTPLYLDAALAEGETFFDQTENISIKTVSVSSQSAQVEITRGTPACLPTAPTLTINPMSQYGYRGEILTYNITIRNNNSACGITTFNVFFENLNNPLTGTLASSSFDLASAETVTFPIQVNSWTSPPLPNPLAAGVYKFGLLVREKAYPAYYAEITPEYIVIDGNGSMPSPTPSIIPVIPGDANGDGYVNEADFVIWLNHYGLLNQTINQGNFNEDGIVNGIDFAIWLKNYGK